MENSITNSGQNKPTPQPVVPSATISRKTTSLGIDRLKNAKTVADQAIKNNKIFTIQGPYPAIREGLRRRGWVEKFYSTSATPKPSPPPKKSKSLNKSSTDENNNIDNDDDDDDDDDDTDDSCDGDGNQIDLNDHGGTVAPWEEENGFYGVTSRLVKNANPTFIWGVRRDVIDPKLLTKEQIINHYGRASFTTKVGLCTHLRNLPWYQPTDSSDFFPRCYKLSHDDEKQEFIDDFFLTACVALLKHISADVQDNESEGLQKLTTRITVPKEAVEIAMAQCRQYLQSLDHDDIDQPNKELNEKEFESFINWYYQALHKNAKVDGVSSKHLLEISAILTRLKEYWPQYEIDGTRNVWIVKPGAKSRGRGIQCYNCLDDMLKLVNSQVARKEGKYVVQKYIERPLLLYQTKFDIRQWFLVTDWNPLTMWFYRECYLRFCSQEYTLDSFDEAIHLSNNAIQKNYKNGRRAPELPNDNMWTSDDFKQHLEKLNLSHLWDELIYPGMKNAITCALLCCQDDVEQRKSAFELYGADFMLDESYHPWLIEINSSPCMAPSTKITAKMCSQVLEDTIRVVIDRKADKNADIGLFELAYKQPSVVIPHYIGINLQVDGMAVKGLDCHTSRRNQSVDLASPVAESQALTIPAENEKSNVTADEILSVKGEKWQHKTSAELPRKSDFPSVISDHDESGKSIQREETETKVSKQVKKLIIVRRFRNTKKTRVERAGGTDDADQSANVESPEGGEPKEANNRADVATTVCAKSTPPVRCQFSHVPHHRRYRRKKEVVDIEERKMRGCSDSEVPKMLTTSDSEEGKLIGSSETEEQKALGGCGDEGKTKTATVRNKTEARKMMIRSHSEERKTGSEDSLQLCPQAFDFVPDLNIAYKTSFITSSNNEQDTIHATQSIKQAYRETMPLKRKFKPVGTGDNISVQGSRLLKSVNIPYSIPTHAKAVTEFPLVLRSVENSHNSNFIFAAKTSRRDYTTFNIPLGQAAPPDGSTRAGQDSSSGNPLPPNVSQIQSYALKPTSSFMINYWKPPAPPTSSSHLPSDSWRTRVALSLYTKAKRQSTYPPNQKFCLKYTTAGLEKSSSFPERLPVGFPSLVSQYLERNYPDGQRQTLRALRPQTPHLSIVTQSFNAW